MDEFEQSKGLKPESVASASRECSENTCRYLNDFLRESGSVIDFSFENGCFVFGEVKVDSDEARRVESFCGERSVSSYTEELKSNRIIHFASGSGTDGAKRMLKHFYLLILFVDPRIDNHFKRFIRDFAHYKDTL